MNGETRKMHGLPPQPYLFFEKVFEFMISKNMGLVVLAVHHGKAHRAKQAYKGGIKFISVLTAWKEG
ncbi:MAG: hypothetical protein KAV87_43285 [Desulfobacteraceae bacterium]|nr:hypothetical protein [Desulfobacteraceae bacterium]